jgi:hypothetical protein
MSKIRDYININKTKLNGKTRGKTVIITRKIIKDSG